MALFSTAGMTLLQQLEGLRLVAYDDGTSNPPPEDGRVVGRLTIGYGHTGPEVRARLVWTEVQAREQLCLDVKRIVGQLDQLVSVSLTVNQFSALACLAFNIGLVAVAGSSALRFANDGNVAGVPGHMQLWDRVEIGGILCVSPGLVGRRAAEVALWQLPDGASPPDFAAIRDQAVRTYDSRSPEQ